MSELKFPVTVSMAELRGGRTDEELLATESISFLLGEDVIPAIGAPTGRLEQLVNDLDAAIGVADLVASLCKGVGDRVSIQPLSLSAVMDELKRICVQVSEQLQEVVHETLIARRRLLTIEEHQLAWDLANPPREGSKPTRPTATDAGPRSVAKKRAITKPAALAPRKGHVAPRPKTPPKRARS